MKDYNKLINKLLRISEDMHWELLTEAAMAIRELQQDAARYNYLRNRNSRTDTCDQCGYDGLHLRTGYLLDTHIDDMMRYEPKGTE